MLKGISVIACLLTLATSSPALGAGTDATGETRERTINLAASQPRVSRGGGGQSGPRCTWTRLTRGEVINLAPGGTLGPQLASEQRDQPATYEQDGTTVTAFIVDCPGTGPRFVLIDTGTTVADLIEIIRDEITETLPLPSPNMNPRPEIGSFVNLGLWLAVDEQTVEPITAEAGLSWITARPQLVDVTFDLGAGDDPVTCDGPGIPYEEGSNTLEPSPTCGYVYEQRGTFTITITTTWEVPYDSSAGSGSLDPIAIDVQFDYQVNEIQTVGTAR